MKTSLKVKIKVIETLIINLKIVLIVGIQNVD